MNIIEKAKNKLIRMRKYSKMYALTRESFVCQVANILYLVVDYDGEFLTAHLKMNGCAYDLENLKKEIEINDEWCYKVIDDALEIIENVNHYACYRCGEVFADCSNFSTCDRYENRFCSSLCGQIKNCEIFGNNCCICRKEYVTDEILFYFILKYYKITRKEIFELYKKEIE